ncbi:hypothetical protein AAFF_G00438820 [Aldrovandia affinis]|uniref:Metalloproteinase inhibitor 2 n=1 Tax=Aldrovandia affinis TaxID=143900 RepID=A0AAD7R362_9TELE|nr:hypothetical protein AAFF_G00438820 [Aldrovandia affinis]
MTCTISSFFVTLTVLLLWRVSEIAEACGCSPVHPQQAFCDADVVIRAKVGAEQEVFSGNDINGYPIQWIQYDIKQIKMFKGPAHDIEAIFTVCGVPLEANGKKEYLIAGKAEADGKMLVTLCDLIMPWDTMSSAQQRSLNLRYQMGYHMVSPATLLCQRSG